MLAYLLRGRSRAYRRQRIANIVEAMQAVEHTEQGKLSPNDSGALHELLATEIIALAKCDRP